MGQQQGSRFCRCAESWARQGRLSTATDDHPRPCQYAQGTGAVLAGQKRRGNIIDQLIDNVGLAGIISGIFTDESDAHIKLTDLLTNHNPSFSAWKKSSRGSLYDDISADTTAWLLSTVSNTANQPAPYNSAAPIAMTSVSHMQDLILRDYIVDKLKGNIK